MERNKKRFAIIGAFAVLFLVGVVYAATTGLLNFGGTARFNQNVKLDIINEAITDEGAGESVVVNVGKDTLTFVVHLATPGETRYVTFKIKNVGNSDAILKTLSTTPPATNTGITVTWPELQDVVVLSGETTSTYTIAVYWNPPYPGVTTDVALSATIDYLIHTP